MENEKGEEKKAHIYEVDFLRAITVFSVVTIHSISTTTFFYAKSHNATNIINLIIHLLHYNREMFVFVTGFVLTYVYFNRQLSAKKFWLKRLLLIVIPYIVWSIIYIEVDHANDKFFYDIYTGNASYQLYYILLAIQFYAIFPFFLWFIKKVYKHPVLVFSISLLAQLIFIYIDFTYFQKGVYKDVPFIKNFLLPYQDRLFTSYQFFFVLGSFVAIYLNKCYSFLKKNGFYSLILFGITIICYSLYYFHQLKINDKESISYTISVLQPSVIFYSIVIITFFSWLSILWVKKKRFFSLIKKISDTSFGIFFVHVMILNYITKSLLPFIPSAVPAYAQIIFVVLTTFILSTLICLLLLRIPFLGWTIGRVKK